MRLFSSVFAATLGGLLLLACTTSLGQVGPGGSGPDDDASASAPDGGSTTADASPAAPDADPAAPDAYPGVPDAYPTVSDADPAAPDAAPSTAVVDAVFVAQTHVLQPDDPLCTLVGSRPALLKAHVIGSAGEAAPPVTAEISAGGRTETLPLTGPSTLPTSLASEPGQVQHSYENSFTVLIPAELVQPGLVVNVRAGASSARHEIRVGAPTVVRMTMFDVHYFGDGDGDYAEGWREELEAKWPVAALEIVRIPDIHFTDLVIPPRAGVGAARVASKQDYKDQTGLNFDGEQAAALKWKSALQAAGGQGDISLYYVNIYGVHAGGQAGGFSGVGNGTANGILHHELGHALSLPHWGDNGSYPYKGDMYGIPAPDIYNGTHAGPAWAFDLPSRAFIPPTVQEGNVGNKPVGTYKASPMQGGGTGDQEPGYLFRHFSDYGGNKMRSFLERRVAIWNDDLGSFAKWDEATGAYTTAVTSNGVSYPLEHDVQVISVMAATSMANRSVNLAYPPIGPFLGGLIRTFDPTSAEDRAAADSIYCPSTGCDYSLRVVQGGTEKTFILRASGSTGDDPLAGASLGTAAVNLRASDGSVTEITLLSTPNVETTGLPADPVVLDRWVAAAR